MKSNLTKERENGRILPIIDLDEVVLNSKAQL